MRFASIFSHRKTIGLVLLAISVVDAVTYGVVTYQTPTVAAPTASLPDPGSGKS